MMSTSLKKNHSLQSSKGKTEAEFETNSYSKSLRMMSVKGGVMTEIDDEIGLDMNISTDKSRWTTMDKNKNQAYQPLAKKWKHDEDMLNLHKSSLTHS